MANIGNLVVKLQAQTDAFKRKMADAKKSVKAFSDDAKSKLETMKKGFGIVSSAIGAMVKTMVAGTAVAAGFFTAMTVRAGTIKEIQQLSDVTGVAVENIQKWQAAGKAVGIETDKMGDIFRDASEKLGELISVGGGEAAELFEKLKLDAADFVGVPVDQALLQIASSMDNLTKNERNALFEMLASDARELIPLLENNGAKLKELGDIAQRTGNVLSADAVKGAVEFRKQWDAIVQRGQGFITQITAKMAPAMKIILERIVEWIDQFGGMEKVAERVGKFMISVIRSMIQGVGHLVKSVSGLEIGWKKVQMAIIAATDAALLLVKYSPIAIAGRITGEFDTEKIRKNLQGAGEMLAGQILELQNYDPNNLPIVQSIDSLLKELEASVGSASSGASSQAEKTRKATEDNTNAISGLNSKISTYTDRLSGMITGGKATGAVDVDFINRTSQQTLKSSQVFEQQARALADRIKSGMITPEGTGQSLILLRSLADRLGALGEGFDVMGMKGVVENLAAQAKEMFGKPDSKPLTAEEYAQVFKEEQEKARDAEAKEKMWREDNHVSLLSLRKFADKQMEDGGKPTAIYRFEVNKDGKKSFADVTGKGDIKSLAEIFQQVSHAV